MAVQLILGIMNPFAMVLAAIAIAAQKLFPGPALTARIVGVIVVVAGLVLFIIKTPSISP